MLLLLAASLALAGSGPYAQTGGEWPTYPIAQAPDSLRPAIQRGDLIVVSLQGSILSELTRELAQGGPAAAIRSCHLDANAAAVRVAREQGIAAGRTSDRLRNPLNAPRPWAAPIVSRYAGQKTAGLDGFVVDLGDRVGLMRPITVQSMCMSCHGAPEKFVTAVRTELKERYPVDRATGFQVGDLRGWFWIEVPKAGTLDGDGNGPRAEEQPQDAEALAVFQRRVQAYVDLHRRLEATVPPLRVSPDPAEIHRAREALGDAIRVARANARPGDIFTLPVAGMFRRLIGESCEGRFEELLAIVNEELEEPVSPPRVNARWDPRAPFCMMPPHLLCGLPPLPEELEYRFINRDLVLYDGHANLIVDVLAGAIPSSTSDDQAVMPWVARILFPQRSNGAAHSAAARERRGA
jgi:hypothetical protein